VKGLGSNVNHLLYQRESAQGPLMMQAQRKETARALESAIQGGKKRFQYVITRKKTKKKILIFYSCCSQLKLLFTISFTGFKIGGLEEPVDINCAYVSFFYKIKLELIGMY
jgi:hypothetical protein